MPPAHPPRKRRTREHIIADMGSIHVECAVVECGFTAERVRGDYGHDLLVFTFDEEGYIEEGHVPVQVKATESPVRTRGGISFPIDIRDYEAWTASTAPIFLVMYDAGERVAYWLYVQNYFASDKTRRPKKKAKTVNVTLPLTNVVNFSWVSHAQACKANAILQARKAVTHNV